MTTQLKAIKTVTGKCRDSVVLEPTRRKEEMQASHKNRWRSKERAACDAIYGM